MQAGTCRCPTRVAGGRPRDTHRRPRSRPACGSLTCGAPGAGKGSSGRPRGRAATLGVLPAHPQGRAGPRGRHAANEPGRPGPGSSVPRGWPAGQSARIPGAWLPARPRPRNPDPVTRWPYRAPGGTSLRSPCGRSRGLSSQRRGVSNCAPGGRRLGELRCPCQVALRPSHPTRPWGCPASALGGREAQPDPLVAAAHAARRSVCPGLGRCPPPDDGREHLTPSGQRRGWRVRSFSPPSGLVLVHHASAGPFVAAADTGRAGPGRRGGNGRDAEEAK